MGGLRAWPAATKPAVPPMERWEPLSYWFRGRMIAGGRSIVGRPRPAATPLRVGFEARENGIQRGPS